MHSRVGARGCSRLTTSEPFFAMVVTLSRLSHKLPMNPKKVAKKLPKFVCFSYLFWGVKD